MAGPGIAGTAGATIRAIRHSGFVRISHWLIALSVFGLIESGIGILISHPRLYWGETGGLGGPSLIDLPLPFVLGPSVWNRPYHFLFAWPFVLTWLAYVAVGTISRHFRNDLTPSKEEFRWSRVVQVAVAHLRGRLTPEDAEGRYNVVQRLVYLTVIFVLFPAVTLTGLGMSFGVTSVFPILATAVGGHQSARTLHFIFAFLILMFVILHIAMLFVAGFVSRTRAMITGYLPEGRSGG
jgi:thiosulfate reductase cytochrome b subunit